LRIFSFLQDKIELSITQKNSIFLNISVL